MEIKYNRLDIQNMFKKFGELKKLDRNRFCLVYGAAAVMHDLKETCNDIDISIMDPDYFDTISSELGVYVGQYKGNPDNKFFKLGDRIDVFRGYVGMKTEPLIERMYLNDMSYLCIQSIPSLLNEKMKHGRDKDIKDLNIFLNELDFFSRIRSIIHTILDNPVLYGFDKFIHDHQLINLNLMYMVIMNNYSNASGSIIDAVSYTETVLITSILLAGKWKFSNKWDFIDGSANDIIQMIPYAYDILINNKSYSKIYNEIHN